MTNPESIEKKKYIIANHIHNSDFSLVFSKNNMHKYNVWAINKNIIGKIDFTLNI